jgi:thiol-disulfide isomerase/thioredoxin
MTTRLWIASFAVSVALTASSTLALELGDPAPALQVAEWIKGTPVDLKTGKGKNVYIVDFWATWCPPCRASIPILNELQKKYKDKGLLLVSISDEHPRLIRPFVKQMGPKMDFTVAADKRQATTRAYLGGAGVNGIPYAFVIDKSGRLAWHGSPLQGLGQVVELVIAGKYDVEAAVRAAKAQKMLGEYFQTAVEADIAVKPNQKRELAKKAKKLGQDILQLAAKSPAILDLLAWNILVLPQLKTRDLDLAVKAASAAYKGTEGKNASIIDTYARTLWDTGKKVEAIKQQTRAVELAKDARIRKQFTETLERYRKEAPKPTSQAAAK